MTRRFQYYACISFGACLFQSSLISWGRTLLGVPVPVEVQVVAICRTMLVSLFVVLQVLSAWQLNKEDLSHRERLITASRNAQVCAPHSRALW